MHESRFLSGRPGDNEYRDACGNGFLWVSVGALVLLLTVALVIARRNRQKR